MEWTRTNRIHTHPQEGAMSIVSVSAERDIAAPAGQVYGVIADYQNHHPRILPPAITDLVVEEGGVGAGTVIRYNARLGGRTRATRQRIEEPEPGRVLIERDLNRDYATTFTVTPSGSESTVRIESTWTGTGMQGFVERLIAPRLLRSLFEDELDRLDRYSREFMPHWDEGANLQPDKSTRSEPG
jgi:hypothetical protein